MYASCCHNFSTVIEAIPIRPLTLFSRVLESKAWSPLGFTQISFPSKPWSVYRGQLCVMLLCVLHIKESHSWSVPDCGGRKHDLFPKVDWLQILLRNEIQVGRNGLIIGGLPQKGRFIWCSYRLCLKLLHSPFFRWRWRKSSFWMEAALVLFQSSLATKTAQIR